MLCLSCVTAEVVAPTGCQLVLSLSHQVAEFHCPTGPREGNVDFTWPGPVTALPPLLTATPPLGFLYVLFKITNHIPRQAHPPPTLNSPCTCLHCPATRPMPEQLQRQRMTKRHRLLSGRGLLFKNPSSTARIYGGRWELAGKI